MNTLCKLRSDYKTSSNIKLEKILQNAPFLFLSDHKNNYNKKLEKLLSKENKDYEGYKNKTSPFKVYK